jgi:general stress protein CsbA
MLAALEKSFGGLCTPAQFWVAFSAITTLGTLLSGAGAAAVAGQVIYVALWALGLNALCEKGYGNAAWVLLVGPILLIVGGLVALLTYGATVAKRGGAPPTQQR